MRCRHCNSELTLPFVDLGSAPPSNAYLNKKTLHKAEKWYPLKVMVCNSCWLVQTEDFAQANELFDDEYAYFSSFSSSWLAHSEKYVVDMVQRFNLTTKSHIVEVAANDGYLLQYAKARKIPCTGIEPTFSTAKKARSKGIPIIEDFFGISLAEKMISKNQKADLTVANNVLAHVPDINDFVAGFAILLSQQGVATFEFPHLLNLEKQNQFDTIYHEHFSYLSLTAVNRIFETNGLIVFDVEELPTHGGSLRVLAQRADAGAYSVSSKVGELLAREELIGMTTEAYYENFQNKTNLVKDDFINFLLNAKKQGKSVVAYGAAAKGNTLINYSGIRPDMIKYVVDLNPAKQGKSMPGSRIPIMSEDQLEIEKPDYVIILPWNLKKEIMTQLNYIRSWNAQFVTAIPHLEIS